MGQWNISIHGTGAHHNARNPTDANRMAAAFVAQLKEAGHVITRATITYGGEEEFTDPGPYIAANALPDDAKQDAEP